ncbi:MAG: amino acid synthesis family protein [Candidatus Methanomethylicaceae archaeon]
MTEEMVIRKILTVVEETITEENMRLEKPVKKAAALAVIKNPFAGRYVQDLSLLFDYGEKLGDLLVHRALKALGIAPEEAKEKVEGYGKGAIVGLAGEIEHPHAILHPKFGAPVRMALGGVDFCKAIIPSTVKMGPAGVSIDMPIVYKRAIWVVSHFDTMTISVPDAPMPDEIVVALALTESGRPLARTAGLQKSEVKGLDGLR